MLVLATLAASLYTLWLSHPALGPGPGQLNCPEAGLSRGWSWSLVEPVPESLEPVDMSEVRCAVSSRATSRWRPRWWVL